MRKQEPRVQIASAELPAPVIPSGDISVRLGDRWGVFGKSGTGKTTFALDLIAEHWKHWKGVQVVIIDPKNSGDFDGIGKILPGSHVYIDTNDNAPEAPKAYGTVLIWKPGVDDKQEYDIFLNRILKNRRKCVLVIDELSSLGGNYGQSYPSGLSRILKQGRGLGITTIVLSQATTKIPDTILGQVVHIVRFGLKWEPDRRRIDRFMGRPESEIGKEPKRQHGFFYYRDGLDKVFEYLDRFDFFKRRKKS